MKRFASFLIISIAFALPSARAEKNADLKPMSAKPGKVMFEDSFDGSALGKAWQINKGTWQIKDGAVAGAMKKEEQHAGVLFLNVPNHNSIIRFSFQAGGNKGFNLSYNTAKGHLFRIMVDPDGLSIHKDRDKKDSKSKNEEIGKAGGKIEPGKWHTMLVEVQGGKVNVQLDTGLKAEATGSFIDTDKTGFRFVTGGSVMLDDVKVWQAE